MYTLIIVDDDELIRKGLEKVIRWEQLGFAVNGTFSNARDALEYIRLTYIDVILTDIKMPEMNGLELIQQVKQYRPNIKSIIISGYGEFELAKKALILKSENYLLKPLGEEEIEDAFLKLKKALDGEREDAQVDKKQKMSKEYELMKVLDNKLQREALFEKTGNGKKYYEMILIKIAEKSEVPGSLEQLITCDGMLRQVLFDSFFCNVDCLFAALIYPENLNGILMHLKREFAKYSGAHYQVLIGREVYSEAEVISSYWSAVALAKEDNRGGVIHYERERNIYKNEWDLLQNLKNNIIKEFENGHFQEIDSEVQQINNILNRYESKDIYYFYCNIITKIIKYFELENSASYLFADRQFTKAERQYQDAEQLRKNFRQDIDAIRKSLWENSDSMRNLIVAKAKAILEQEYADDNLSLASIANQLSISYGYLSTIFTKNVGYSFKSYLVEVRMEKARSLLLTRNYKIYEIAEMVGYRNPRYFTDAFKKYFNYSPADYIARFRGEK